MPPTAPQNQFAKLLMLLSLVVIGVVMYLAQEVLIPLALAALFSFLLAPLVARVEHWGVGRITSVLLVTGVTFAFVAGLTFIVAGQLLDLTEQLPQYRTNIRAKVDSLRGSSGSFSKAADAVDKISEELQATQPTSKPSGKPEDEPDPKLSYVLEEPAPGEPPENPPADPKPKPIPVEVHEPPPTPVEYLRETIGPLLAPLATAGIVVIFAIFFLIQREDLRNRFIRLTGQHSLYATTAAIDDAANRVSRYLRANLVVNVTYGIPIGVGLYLIGVPNALLWGLLATFLRFIPYIGPWIAASMPIALSLAVFDNWTRPAMVVGLFVVIELISNNVVEPWLYGASTGMSSVAVLVAAVFWAWLWGPVGLLLSTPLTVCLVVIGKHLPQMEFLSILFGDEEVLNPQSRFYQRLLAKDHEEATEIAVDLLKTKTLVEVYDTVLIPALHLAEMDRHNGRLDLERQSFIRQSMRDMIDELGEAKRQLDTTPAKATLTEVIKEKAAAAAAAAGGQPAEAKTEPTPPPEPPTINPDLPPTLVLPARDAADEIVGLMLAQALERRGVKAEVLGVDRLAGEMIDRIESSNAPLVCVSALPPSAVTHARYLCKRIKMRFTSTPTVIGLWNASASLERAGERIGCGEQDKLVTTLAQATDAICLVLQSPVVRRPEDKPGKDDGKTGRQGDAGTT